MKIGGINVPIITTFDPKGLSAAEQRLAKFGQAANVALAGIATGAFVAVSAAVEDAAAQDKLATTLKNVTGATDGAIAANEKFISNLTLSTGVADDQLRPSLDRLVRSTEDVATAQDLLQIAMDVSQGTGKDLETVSNAIAKAYDGEFTSLKRLGVPLDEATIKSGNFADVAKKLSDTFGGQVQASTETAAGRFQILKNRLNESTEEIGAKLLPTIENLLPKLESAAKFVSDNTNAILILVGVIGTFAAIIKITQGAMVLYNAVNLIMEANAKRAAAGQWALNTAVLANPFVLITVAVIALVAAIVYLWNNNEAFREAVIKAWEAIKNTAVRVWEGIIKALGAAWDWIVETAKKIWGGITKFFADVWDKMKTGASDAWDGIVTFFKSAPDKIKNAFTAAARLFMDIGKNIVEGIKNGLGNAWDSFTSFVSDKVGGIVSGVKNLLGISSPSKVFRGIGKNMVDGLAIGIDGMDGVVNKKLADVRAAATLGNVAFSTPTAANGVNQTAPINITVNGAIDSESTARQIYNILQQSAARTGNYTGLGLAPLSI